MKKALRFIALILTCLMFAAVFAGCGSENGEPAANGGDKDLLGRWLSVDGSEEILEFNADGSGASIHISDSGKEVSYPFRYQLEGANRIIITLEVSNDILYTYSIIGNILTFHDEAYSNDYEIVYKRIN